MRDKDTTSLVPKPSGQLARLSPRAGAIIDGMVNDATEVMRVRDASQQKKADSQSNTRSDPEVMTLGTKIAAFHVEAGARSFADFARKMVEEFGEKIKPYLKAFYNGARNCFKERVSPDMQPYADEIAATMDSAEAVEEMAKPEALEEILNGEADKNRERLPGKSMRRGRGDE